MESQMGESEGYESLDDAMEVLMNHHDELHACGRDLEATINDLETDIDRLQNEKQLIL